MEYSPASIPRRMNVIATAFRNIRNGKAFSIINIFGLAMGLAVCLLRVSCIR
jgi:hypothetical protein